MLSMAGKDDTPRTRIESIKTDLQSIASCTNATVTALQALLDDKIEVLPDKENLDSSKRPPVRTVQASARTKSRSVTVSATVGTAKKSSSSIICLTPREKYVLATETANATLKSLTDALKLQSSSQTSRPTSTPKTAQEVDTQPTSKRAGHTRTVSSSQKPLQERLPSQASNSPVKPSTLRQSTSRGQDPSLVATAECARLAFAYLRTPEAIKIAGKDVPKLQLENGILALVGKLVAHGLDSLAIKELRILKKRLDAILEVTKPCKESGAMTQKPAQKRDLSERESIASLLGFQNVEQKKVVLPIVVSHQAYTLRIMARMRRPGLFEDCWNYLTLSNPCSPANLLWHAAKLSNGDSKFVRQLESLAQTMLSMCSSSSSPDFDGVNNDRFWMPAEICLSLQHAAFKVRRRWWRMAKHQGNVNKELLEPFGKCVSAFTRRSKLPATQNYELAKSLFEDLASCTEDPEPNESIELSSIASVAMVMSNLANVAGLSDEAFTWLGASVPSTSKDPAARRTSRLIRMATITLDNNLKGKVSKDSGEVLSNALEALTGSLEGSSFDLEALFVEVNSLRRVASRAICSTAKTQDNSDTSSSILEEAVQTIKATVRFTARYIGPRVVEKEPAQPLRRYQERVALVLKSLKSIIDSMSLCCKLPVYTDPGAYWTNLDTLIQDCVFILQHYDGSLESLEPLPKLPDELQCPFVKLSNAYWTLYLQLKIIIGSKGPAILSMQRSIDILQSRSQAEQISGLIAMKFERLGEAYETSESFDQSRKAFWNSIESSINSGVLQMAAEIASKHPPKHIFTDTEGPTVSLGRILKLLHQSFLKSIPKDSNEVGFYDDCELTAEQRGLLLEWQLALYVKSLSRNRTWDSSLNPSVLALSTRILDVYSLQVFPVRRMRASVMILQIHQDHPDLFPLTSLPSSILIEPTDTGTKSEDKSLLCYRGHLKAMLKLKLSMLAPSKDTSNLNESCLIWQKLIDGASSWKELEDKIDDFEGWLRVLQNTADYLAASGEEYLSVSVLQLLAKALELQESLNLTHIVSTLSTLGLQLLHLGYTGKAGLALAKAETLISKNVVPTETILHWHVAYAEYLLRIGNSTKCKSVLAAAESIAHADAEFMNLGSSSTTISGRLRFNRVIADACYVYSLFALSKGLHKDASQYAKQCTILNRRIWAALESKSHSKKSREEDFDPLSSIRNENGVPVIMSNTHESLSSPEFWSLVPFLYRGLMQQSRIYTHQGLLLEAMYAAEQAEKVAIASNSRSLILDNSSTRADLWAQSGRSDKAMVALASIEDLPTNYKHLSMVAYHSSKARILRLDGEIEKELEVYQSLDELLQELTLTDFVKSLYSFSSDIDAVTEQLSAVSLNAVPKPTRGRKVAPKTAPKPTSKVATRAPRRTAQKPVPNPTAATATRSISDECLSLQTLQAEVARRKALAHLDVDNLEKAFECLELAKDFEKSVEPSFLQLWTSFKASFSRSMKELAEDFTFSTLPESTIAFPSVVQNDRGLSELPAGRRVKITPPAKATAGKGKTIAKEDFIALLQEARECLVESHALCSQTGSAHQIQQASVALSQVTVLLSAVSENGQHGNLHPLYAAYMSEIPKLKSLQFAQESIEVDQENLSREQYLAWPRPNQHPLTPISSASDFQKDFVDIIPPSWTAVALALNEGCDELYITRYEAGLTPFVLRLPMGRHSSRDMDEVEFTFADGKREFDEIIYLSDFSTRSAKDMTSKEARVQWWEGREALDTKLHELLLNIENIWLGGFKGIFSQQTRQPALLARFRKSFDNILNRHLPSRKGKGKQKKSTLDSRVLELFTGLGDATNEELDLDEALLDLLYFVVDILQFHGEQNPYDEIDFDTMTIETLDALRAYHDSSQSTSERTAHTILILDKTLHAFPWESMPCLQSHSTSRLPSLSVLRERILASKPSKNKQNTQPGHYISASAGGTSILNPSGDLKHTLKILKPRLDRLQGNWSHIVNRAPSENEFESALKENDLVMYFGHGSGAQFVRSKSVRRLYPGRDANKPGCATTFLFGCSSVHLSDNGIYEPSGMLASYLTAGAPAVVGMLWDVTDKDCDRFAVRTGELWGLWPEMKEDADIPKTAKKSKGKGKVAQLVAEVETARGMGVGKKGKKPQDQVDSDNDDLRSADSMGRKGVGLDEAIRAARDACVLRYLNGAAAVMYGIPVYLE
ncbi:peptidase family C50-domain-containing protein [Dendryphion nanum]|uniref:separase n=1 Tax=Dendryphion nanum TaxID=256645 RepID=A0A9P9DVN2_9PLEO|nr:peptidase family C50-domain-containing protein [Dendryphion nanum]